MPRPTAGHLWPAPKNFGSPPAVGQRWPRDDSRVPPSTVWSDNFDRANGEIGNGWLYWNGTAYSTSNAGSNYRFDISGGKVGIAVASATTTGLGGGGLPVVVYRDVGTDVQDISLDFSDLQRPCIVFDHLDEQNWSLYTLTTSNEIILTSRVAGTSTQIHRAVKTPNLVGTHRLQYDGNGTLVVTYPGGTQETFTLPAKNGTRCGIGYSNANLYHLDNFSVTTP